MVKKIILCLFIINAHFTYSQNAKKYYYRVEPENFCKHLESMRFALELDKPMYQLSYTGTVALDILPEPVFLISRGTYIRKKDKYFLTDSKTKVKMIFVKKDSCFIPIKIFSGLINKSFSLPFFTSDYIEKISRIDVETLRKHNTENNVKYHTLYYGVYSGNGRNVRSAKIELIKPNRYKYYIDDFLLSEGVFRRIGRTNELLLTDKEIGDITYFFINDKSLLDNFSDKQIRLLKQ